MSMMLPPDIAQLAAQGGDPAAAAGPMPPDIGAMLDGLGGGMPAPGGEPEGDEAPVGPSDGSPGGGQDALEQAIALLDQAIAEEADQEDQQIMRQCSAKLQAVLAKNQADADAALGGKASPKAMRKQAASVGGGY